MTPATLVGLDIGTLGVKGVLVTTGGQVLARAYQPHVVREPQPGWSEHRPEQDWWRDSVVVLRTLLQTPGVEPAHIAAVGISGLTPCLALLDAEGRPIRPALLYSDNRAIEQLAHANRQLGGGLTAEAITPKWMWLAEHEPEHVAGAQTLLSSHNYVILKLTGRATMDYDTASILGGLFTAPSGGAPGHWDVNAGTRLGLDLTLLPAPMPVTATAGHVSSGAGQITGLPSGVPVIAGTGDTFPTLLGCGAIEHGDAMLSFGTTGLLTLTVRPLVSAIAGPHFAGAEDGGAVEWAANILACGRSLAWFQQSFAPQPRGVPSFAELDDGAAAVPAGSLGLIALPHLVGRRSPAPLPAACGVFFGLQTAHTAAHVYRALLEAFGYAVRQGFETIRPRTRRVIATGGGATSPLWRQIVASILDTPLEHHPAAAGALGIAFLAGYATGHLTRFDVLATDWLRDPLITHPDSAWTATYGRLYGLYSYLDDSLGPAYSMRQEALR